MQKSKNYTILIIMIMLLFGLIGAGKLIFDINTVYIYIY